MNNKKKKTMTDKTLVSFDYAIKQLLKTKSDYEIVEGFISVILGAFGYKPVKISALLDPESNKEDKNLKRSVADLIVEDLDGNQYIVEIDRSYTDHFAHKACFNTSRLIVDNLSTNMNYTQIKKIFHINLIYFEAKYFDSPFYHAKTSIHKVDTDKAEHVCLSTLAMQIYQFDAFPEYIFISVPNFNGVVKKELDEWMYMLKNSSVRDDFKSPYMEKIREKLSLLKMTADERNDYYKYLKENVDKETSISDIKTQSKAEGEAIGIEKGEAIGIEKGEAIGIEKGEKKEQIRIAKEMLQDNTPVETIAKYTKLSEEEVKKLR